jgi:hypothetical protein
MNTQCKDGDIAIIIKEDPGCERNLGKAVYVSEPVTIYDDVGICWYITPVQEIFWAYLYGKNDHLKIKINPTGVYHPDSWMIPINRKLEDDSIEETQTLVEEV